MDCWQEEWGDAGGREEAYLDAKNFGGKIFLEGLY